MRINKPAKRVDRPKGSLDDSKTLRLIESITKTMDNKFNLPGTKFKFGLDPIIGLIPYVGEAVTFSISSMLILTMMRYGTSKKVVYKMVGNLLVDTIIGAIPLVGDLFDFGFKANTRNVRLLKEHHAEGKHKGSGWGMLIIVALVLLAFLTLLVFGIVKLIEFVF